MVQFDCNKQQPLLKKTLRNNNDPLSHFVTLYLNHDRTLRCYCYYYVTLTATKRAAVCIGGGSIFNLTLGFRNKNVVFYVEMDNFKYFVLLLPVSRSGRTRIECRLSLEWIMMLL